MSFSQKQNLQDHQRMAYKLAKSIISKEGIQVKSIVNHKPYQARGMVFNHETGSGKTAIIAFILLYAARTDRFVSYVTTKNNLSSDPLGDFRREIQKFQNLSKNDETNLQKVRFYNYETFGSCTLPKKGDIKDQANSDQCKKYRDEVGGKGAVVVFDEAHELIHSTSHYERERKVTALLYGHYVANANTEIMSSRPDTVVIRPRDIVFCFTATPAQSDIRDLAKMLNVTRPFKSPEVTSNAILSLARKNHIINHIHIGRTEESKLPKREFVDMSHKLSPIHFLIICMYVSNRHSIVNYDENMNKNKNKNKKSKNSENKKSASLTTLQQMQAYLTDTQIEESLTGLIDFVKMRIKDIILSEMDYYPEKRVYIPKNGKITHTIRNMVGAEYCSIEKIRGIGRQVVYCKHKKTAEIIIHVLQKQCGDKLKKVEKSESATNILRDHVLRTPTNNSTYIFKDDVVVMVASSKDDDRLIKAFNSDGAKQYLDIIQNGARERRKQNYEEGQFCQILFLTGEFYQGTNIRGVRRFHMFDYLPGYTLQKQLNGRATRAGSHSSLVPEKRSITIFKYKTQPEKDKTLVTQFIENRIRKPLNTELDRVNRKKRTDKFAENIGKLYNGYETGLDILKEYHKKYNTLGRATTGVVVPNTIIRQKAQPTETNKTMENIMGKYNIGEIKKLLKNTKNRSNVMQLYKNHIGKKRNPASNNRATTGNQKRPRTDNWKNAIEELKSIQNKRNAGMHAKQLLNKIKASQLNKTVQKEYVKDITQILRNKMKN